MMVIVFLWEMTTPAFSISAIRGKMTAVFHKFIENKHARKMMTAQHPVRLASVTTTGGMSTRASAWRTASPARTEDTMIVPNDVAAVGSTAVRKSTTSSWQTFPAPLTTLAMTSSWDSTAVTEPTPSPSAATLILTLLPLQRLHRSDQPPKQIQME